MHETFLLILFLILAQNVHSKINEDNCIPIKQCSKAMEMLKTKDRHPINIQLLRSSQCGYSDQPLVNCKMLGSMDTSLSSCIPIKQCTIAMKLLKLATTNDNIRRLLQFSQCGHVDSQPKVNCTYINKQMITLGHSSCIPIKQCTIAMKLLKLATTNENIRRLLQLSQCGSVDSQPKVNCTYIDKQMITLDKYVDDEDCVHIKKCPQAYDHPNILKTAYCGIVETKVKCSLFPNEIVDNEPVSQCGIQGTSRRIYSGNVTSLDEFPWMALIYANFGYKIDYNCHGTVINSKFVLTAAHCVYPDILKRQKIKNLDSVVLGEYDTRTEIDCVNVAGTPDCADSIERYKIDDILIHPNFNGWNEISDIALLKLDREIIYTDFIKPICLPPKNIKIKENEKLWVSGWGKTETYGSGSPVKLKAVVPLVNSKNCKRILKRNLPRNIICAGRGDGADTCKGDSGGPLMLAKMAHKNIFIYQIGIVSIGSKCGGGPATYTYVPNYIDWIVHNTKN